MKKFLEIVEEQEQTKKPVVMAFGRMNPPTTGHLKLIDKVRSLADKMGAKHTVVVSHSQDSKKNPLSGDQKVKHLGRYSPGTHFQSSSKESPTILHHAAKLHAAGHDHLVVVGGSDRVKEMHELLHRYNGVEGKHGYFNFKKIEVKSAGHRDPDAEGAEGMSGTKMREHSKNKDFSSFRQGVPSHVSDEHAKELMKDVRKGMGLNEQVDRGVCKAIFVTGGPGSGKDIIIRECIAESKSLELNYTQVKSLLEGRGQKNILRNRTPLVINGPADDFTSISNIKENLECLGYSTMMVFVDTSNESSQERNSKLSRMMVESVRFDKWEKSQLNKKVFGDIFDTFIHFDNNRTMEDIEEDITLSYETINNFIDSKPYKNTLTKESLIKKLKYKADGPDDITPDNRASEPVDDIKYDAPKKRSTYTFKTYSEANQPTISVRPEPKEPNFTKDKESTKKKKWLNSPTVNQRIRNVTTIGQEFDTRQQGTVYPMSGLGDVTYREQKEFSSFRKEAIDDPGAVDMGVGGTLGGASNKEPMQSYKDQERNIGITIKKKKVKTNV
jgi:cytidyltransferase-like protein